MCLSGYDRVLRVRVRLFGERAVCGVARVVGASCVCRRAAPWPRRGRRALNLYGLDIGFINEMRNAGQGPTIAL